MSERNGPGARPLVSVVATGLGERRGTDPTTVLDVHRAVAAAHPRLRFELVVVEDGPDAVEFGGAGPDDVVRVARLVRAAGPYGAFCAGLAVARGDAVLVLDAAQPGAVAIASAVLAEWLDPASSATSAGAGGAAGPGGGERVAGRAGAGGEPDLIPAPRIVPPDPVGPPGTSVRPGSGAPPASVGPSAWAGPLGTPGLPAGNGLPTNGAVPNDAVPKDAVPNDAHPDGAAPGAGNERVWSVPVAHDVVWAVPGGRPGLLRRVPGLPVTPGERRPSLLVDRSVLDVVHSAPTRDVVAAIARGGRRQTTVTVDAARRPGRLRRALGWLVGLRSAPFVVLVLVGLGVAAAGVVGGLWLISLSLVVRVKIWTLVFCAVLLIGGLNLAALGWFGEHLRRAGPPERAGYVLGGVRDLGPRSR